MSIESNLLRQLTQVFIGDLNTQTGFITEGLLVLEKEQFDSHDTTEIYNSLFRAAHNIKGAAKGVGFDEISKIAHALESIFNALITQEIAINPDIVDLALRTVDTMKQVSSELLDNLPPSVNVIEPLLSDLNTILQPNNQETIAEISEPSEKTIPTQFSSVSRANELSGHISVDPEKIEILSEITEDIHQARIELNDITYSIGDIKHQLLALQRSIKHSLPDRKFLDTDNNTDANVKSYIDHTLSSVRQLERRVDTTTRHLRNSNTVLRQEIHELRLVPISNLTTSLQRVVRDICRSLGKHIQLTIDGDDIEIDRLILNTIRDPLIHIIRNAADHGIENKKLRQQRSKSITGTIAIKIAGEGNKVKINISDDGGGIDVEAIVTTALKKGLISEDSLSSLSHQDKLQLIFQPGLSSSQTISEYSGRGVGMDVVLNNINLVKGEINVQSTLEKGTVLEISLPVSLATERAITIRVGNCLFAITNTAIDKVLQTDVGENIDSDGHIRLTIHGNIIPIFILSQLLGIERSTKPTKTQSVVIINNTKQKIGLVVDDILHEREMVIRPLGFPLDRLVLFKGGTSSNKGDIVFVMNEHELIARATSSNVQLELPTFPPVKSIQHVLIVDDSITMRTLIKNIVESAGHTTTTAVDGEQAWKCYTADSKIDLIITDIEMPNMGGIELIKKIRSDAQRPHIPIIVVSSLASQEQRHQGLNAGANAYLVKSEFDSQDLLEHIQLLKQAGP